jgi:hypothetical protein
MRRWLAVSIVALMIAGVPAMPQAASASVYVPTTVVRADVKGDLYPAEWAREYKKSTRLSADLTKVTYVVDREAQTLKIVYKVRDMRRDTNKIRFSTVMFGPLRNRQRDILWLTTVKGKDDPTVVNEREGATDKCSAAKARTKYVKNRMRVTIPFSCLFGKAEFKLASNTEAYRPTLTRNVIGDNVKWTPMLSFVPLDAN